MSSASEALYWHSSWLWSMEVGIFQDMSPFPRAPWRCICGKQIQSADGPVCGDGQNLSLVACWPDWWFFPSSGGWLAHMIVVEPNKKLSYIYVYCSNCKQVASESCSVVSDYTVHGILQARILEWVPYPFSRGSSWPRDLTQVSFIAGGFFTNWATREALLTTKMWANVTTCPLTGEIHIDCVEYLTSNTSGSSSGM